MRDHFVIDKKALCHERDYRYNLQMSADRHTFIAMIIKMTCFVIYEEMVRGRCHQF